MRPDLLDDAQGVPDRARPAVPRHGHLARADAAVHRRGGVARALSVRRRLRASRTVPRGARRLARRGAGGEMAQGAQRPPRRHRRARDRARAASASAPRSRPTPSSMCPTPTCSRRWSTSTWPRSRSPRRRRWSRATARPRPSGSTTSRAWRSRCGWRKGTKCARSWKILPSVGSDPGLSRRLAARRPGAARMGRDAQGGGVTAGDRRIRSGGPARAPLLRGPRPASRWRSPWSPRPSIRRSSSGCSSSSIWARAAS